MYKQGFSVASLKAEGMEEQAIDCMECLEVYVKEIKEMVDKQIKESN